MLSNLVALFNLLSVSEEAMLHCTRRRLLWLPLLPFLMLARGEYITRPPSAPLTEARRASSSPSLGPTRSDIGYCGSSSSSYSTRPASYVEITDYGGSCSGASSVVPASASNYVYRCVTATNTPRKAYFAAAQDGAAVTSLYTYLNNMECYWTIAATSSTRVAITFSDSYLSGVSCGFPSSRRLAYGTCAMSIEPQGSCNYDHLSALRGNKVSTSGQSSIELENSINKNGDYRLCGDAIPAPKPVYSTSAGGYKITWSFHSDNSISKYGFLGIVTYFTPIELIGFPSTWSSCAEEATDPKIQLLDYQGNSKTDEPYTVTVSVVSGTTTIQGRYTDVASNGLAVLNGFKLCGVNSDVRLRFVSELFDYTHSVAYNVVAAKPNVVDVSSIGIQGTVTTTSIPVKWTLPSDNGNALSGCKDARL